MSQPVFLALVLPLLVAECIAQFVLHDQELTALAALAALAVIAIRWALGPRTAEDAECHPDCPKCAESMSSGGED